MAIVLDVTHTPIGVGFKNAYARISTLQYSRKPEGGHIVMIDVPIYAVPPGDNTPNVDFKRLFCAPEDLVGDTLPAAYEWLKLQPEFAGAVDA